MRIEPLPIGNGEQRSSSIAQQVERDAGRRHVEDRVELADLVEVDRVGGRAVHARLGLGQPAVDRARPLALARRQPAALHDRQHVGQVARAAAGVVVAARVAVVAVRVAAVVVIVRGDLGMVVVFVVAVLAGDHQAGIGRRDAELDDPPRLEAPAVRHDRAQGALERVAVDARVEKRRQQHVARRPAHHVDVTHRGPAVGAVAHAAIIL